MPSVSFAYIQSIESYLASLGVSTDKLSRLTQKHRSPSGSSRVSMEAYVELLNQGVSLTNNSLFGFELGKDIQAKDYGVLGYLIESCENLAQAIGVRIKERYPEKTVLYISAEKFTQQFIDSVKANTRNDFIHFYQMIDVLIVDDVQFLSGKSGTQDVFFHIFNHLHQNGKQVILTSDKAPVDMQDIEQRLLSRFKWGLSAELQTPDFETRVSILKNKLYRDGVEMPEDIIEYVAKHIKTNIRELEGAIISLIAQSSFNKKEITIDLARIIVEKFGAMIGA